MLIMLLQNGTISIEKNQVNKFIVSVTGSANINMIAEIGIIQSVKGYIDHFEKMKNACSIVNCTPIVAHKQLKDAVFLSILSSICIIEDKWNNKRKVTLKMY